MLLRDYDYKLGDWYTKDEILDNDVDYVVVASKLVETGYDAARPSFYAWVPQQLRRQSIQAASEHARKGAAHRFGGGLH